MTRQLRRAFFSALCVAGTLGGTSQLVMAGDPTPPSGPVGPTMKTLNQVEPRIPVESLHSTATAMYLISTPGSYYLTGNLVGVDGKNGIEITTDGVSLDLSGFTLTGSPASLSGVYVTSPGTDPFGVPLRRTVIDISNGAATGWGSSGIDAWFASGSSLHGLRASMNTVDGFRLGDGECRDSQAVQNGDDGFESRMSTMIHNFTSMSNGMRGLRAGAGSEVFDCVVRTNGSTGISVGEASFVRGCVISINGDDGLLLSRLGFALNNYSCGNGTNGVGDGIRASSSGCRIESNMVTMNQTYGISTDIGNNVITCNTARSNMMGSFNLIGVNTVGPILTAGAITSTNPWANFSY